MNLEVGGSQPDGPVVSQITRLRRFLAYCPSTLSWRTGGRTFDEFLFSLQEILRRFPNSRRRRRGLRGISGGVLGRVGDRQRVETTVAKASFLFVAGDFSFVAAFGAERKATIGAATFFPEEPEGLSAGTAPPRHGDKLFSQEIPRKGSMIRFEFSGSSSTLLSLIIYSQIWF